MFSVKERKEIYQKTIRFIENDEDCIAGICFFICEIIGIQRYYESECDTLTDCIKSLFPEFALFEPEDVDPWASWWPINVEGDKMRILALELCIQMCE